MEAVDVSIYNNSEKYINRVWLLLVDFERNNIGEVKTFPNNSGGEYIMAIFKITRGSARGQIVSHLIPISGEAAGYGRRFIRDMMEASGFAKKGQFQSYSIQNYEDLVKLHFPAYLRKNSTVIEHVLNPYKELNEVHNYGV